MDTNDYYTLLVPVFLGLMGIEAWAARRRGLKIHRLADSLSNLSCGFGQILMGIFTGGFLLWTYSSFHAHFALVDWGDSWVPWVLAFVGVDLCYYLFHRAQHGVALLWAVHAVHHQSEELNVSVALRQPWFSDFSALAFFWPLPLLGVPLPAFFLAVGVLSLYEAMMHTRLVDATGPWGWLFNTPAFHRLHHSRERRHADRNFASTLIVWDRLFGTFEPAATPTAYGTHEKLASDNPLWAQAQPVLALLARARACSRWRDRIRLVFGRPRDAATTSAHTPQLPHDPRLAVYALGQFVAAGLLGLALLATADRAGPLISAVIVAAILWATAAVGGLLEGRGWAYRLELLRVAVTLAIASAAATVVGLGWMSWTATAVATASLGALTWFRLSPARAGDLRPPMRSSPP